MAKSFHLYVDYINSQHVSYNELKNSILIYNMESRFKQFHDYPEKPNKKASFLWIYMFIANQMFLKFFLL